MKEIHLLLVIVLLMLGILISQPVSAVEPAKIKQPQNQGGQRAYIDPDTGQMTSSPTPEQTRKALQLSTKEQNAMSTSHAGLVQEEIPGKGIKVDLQGRFQSSTFATVGDSGEVSISHSADKVGESQTLTSEQGDNQKQGE